jgi:hypothetical protein
MSIKADISNNVQRTYKKIESVLIVEKIVILKNVLAMINVCETVKFFIKENVLKDVQVKISMRWKK